MLVPPFCRSWCSVLCGGCGESGGVRCGAVCCVLGVVGVMQCNVLCVGCSGVERVAWHGVLQCHLGFACKTDAQPHACIAFPHGMQQRAFTPSVHRALPTASRLCAVCTQASIVGRHHPGKAQREAKGERAGLRVADVGACVHSC